MRIYDSLFGFLVSIMSNWNLNLAEFFFMYSSEIQVQCLHLSFSSILVRYKYNLIHLMLISIWKVVCVTRHLWRNVTSYCCNIAAVELVKCVGLTLCSSYTPTVRFSPSFIQMCDISDTLYPSATLTREAGQKLCPR